jgi:uncharacterized phage protein (TIGR01671 family)
MREILFRGKALSSYNWIYGFPVQDKFGWFFHDPERKFSRIYVITGTVNQYTGLIDKNGRKIFEGDIVSLNDVVCPITFEDGAFQMVTDEQQGRSVAVQQRLKRFEIIGNIYDNPELLEK